MPRWSLYATVLRVVLENGARPVLPGEIKRFLNGNGPYEAESVMNIISAHGEQASMGTECFGWGIAKNK